MTFAKGRGVRIEVAATYGAAKTVTEVTEANPPECTSLAHGLSAKSVGYFSVATGMPALEGQACRLSAVITNGFSLEDLDSTNYGNFTGGTFIPVATWVTLASATDYAKAGGESAQDDVTVLMDEISQNEAGLPSAESVNISCRTLTISDSALALVRAAVKTGGYVIFRVTLKDGSVRVWRGQPSMPTESVAVGQVGQTTFSSTVKGWWIEGAA